MAGRAGRQGIDRDGLVFSVLDDTALVEAPLERILSGTPESVMSRFKLSYSTILHLLVSLGRERLFEAWEKSFHHFQHRAGTEKAQLKLRAHQRVLLEAHLNFLTENGYVDKQDQLTPKGSVARLLNGYEIQLTELLFRGFLKQLAEEELAVLFHSIVYEAKKADWARKHDSGRFKWVKKSAYAIVDDIGRAEERAELEDRTKSLEFKLAGAVEAWTKGCTLTGDIPSFFSSFQTFVAVGLSASSLIRMFLPA